jgi:hypothetical protein
MIHTDLKHSSNQGVDFFFSISPVTSLLERMSFVVESALGGVELKGPEEVVGFLEMRTTGDEFVDQFFDRLNTDSAQTLLNDFIGSKRDSLLIDLSVSSLVDQIRNEVSGGVAKGDIRFNLLKHIQSGSVYSDQSGVVDLSKSEQLEDLSDLRSQMVDTSNSDNESNLRFGWDIERVLGSGFSAESDELFSLVSMVLGEFSSLLGICFSSSLGSLLSVCQEFLSGLSQLGVSGSLLSDGLGDVLLGFAFLNFHLSKSKSFYKLFC